MCSRHLGHIHYAAQYSKRFTGTMPEREGERTAETAVTEVPTTAPEKTAHPIRGGDAVERVSWPVEDPSEYRPEFAPGGSMYQPGKEKKKFRAYNEAEVSYTPRHVCIACRLRSNM